MTVKKIRLVQKHFSPSVRAAHKNEMLLPTNQEGRRFMCFLIITYVLKENTKNNNADQTDKVEGTRHSFQLNDSITMNADMNRNVTYLSYPSTYFRV